MKRLYDMTYEIHKEDDGRFLAQLKLPVSSYENEHDDCDRYIDHQALKLANRMFPDFDIEVTRIEKTRETYIIE